MIKNRVLWLLVLLLVVSSVSIAGCASTGATRFYVLSSLSGASTETEASAADHDLVIGIGPIELPDYLDRPQIVTRASRNELRIAEFDQWAEPLKSSLSRVLAENLSNLLHTDRIVIFPWKRSTPVDYKVTVEVIRFDTGTDGQSVLVARWSVLEGDKRILLLSSKSSFSEPATALDYESIVSAMSKNITQLSNEVAAVIKEDSK